MDPSVMWTDQGDSNIGGTVHDDFQQFLNLGMDSIGEPLQFEFPHFESQSHAPMPHESGINHDTHMDGAVHSNGHEVENMMMQDHHALSGAVSTHSTVPNTPIDHIQGHNESLNELDAQIQYLQQQRQQQHQRQLQEQQRNFYAQSNVVPPTPNSIEMHGGTNSFYIPQDGQQQQDMYDRYQVRPKEQDVCPDSLLYWRVHY
jgi:hypothetical protein